MFLFPLPKDLKLTSAHKKLLRTLVIDENGPGTILHDFEVLLSAFKDGKLSITPGQQLPSNVVTSVNARLKHPIQLGLQRTQQKSYPPVHGLYLLLRASGLTYVEGTAAKPVLRLDEEIHQQWNTLNPIEQFGTLLESWLIRGKPEIVGEWGRPFDLIPENFGSSAQFYVEIPDDGQLVTGKRDVDERIRYSPGLYNLGLLYLFGLIEIEESKPEPGRGWRIARVNRTPFGDALFAALNHDYFEHLHQRLMSGYDSLTLYGALQEPLQAYWPDFRHTLALSPWTFRDGTYIFKVSLDDTIWRRIAIGAHESMDILAGVVLASVEFDMDHLYRFSYQSRFGIHQQMNHPYMDDPPYTSELRVGDVPLRVGRTLNIEFDFGDNWEFTLTLEQVDPKQTIEQPDILEAHGESPKQYVTWEGDDEDWDEDDGDWDGNEDAAE